MGGSDSGYDSNSGDGPRTNDEEQFGQLSSPKASDKSSKPVGFLKQWQQDSKQMQGQLKSLGAAGIIAYGTGVCTHSVLPHLWCHSAGLDHHMFTLPSINTLASPAS